MDILTESKEETVTETKKKPHILVVEDEVNLAVGLRFSLEHENYDVTLIHDGDKALECLLKNSDLYDVIVLDIMLPGVNGYTICSQARSQGILTPIMFFSAKTLPEEKAHGFDVGANQYLSKPFDLDEFLARIRNMLKLHQLQSGKNPKSENDVPEKTSDEIRIGNVTADLNTLEVRTPTRTLHLTFLEMTLLKYFIQNADRLIPKEELLENVWKTSGGMNTRAPDQFILRLRKIFEPDPTHPRHFLTYRNAGYRFVQEEQPDSL